MNYGIQISTSGVMNAMYRQDVLSNNLANLNTTAYKPDVPESRFRDAVRDEDNLAFMSSNSLLERLGGGVTPFANRVSFAQGALETTGNPLDLGIQNEGFFVVQGPGGEGTQLTRDGRFTMDSRGRLVMANTGQAVLGAGNRPITLDPGQTPQITGDGVISQGGRQVARLSLMEPADKSQLRKAGAGLFDIDAALAQTLRPATGTIQQHTLEMSAVNEIKALMDVQSASRAVSGNIGMITYQDRMMDMAINRFGRIS
ncbi:MAG: flagellar basal body rod protein FlgG [Phycisphaerales bacterium]|jgi:flagellar basal body rod protein FlgG